MQPAYRRGDRPAAGHVHLESSVALLALPGLSAGPTPRTRHEEWSFTINGAVDEPLSWSWEQFIALPAETITVDIHCVTKWSKLDTTWKGVSLDTLLETRFSAVQGVRRLLVPLCV